MTAPDPARLHQSIRQLEGDGGRVDVDVLDLIEAAIAEQAAVWEVEFDSGPGMVVGLPDAAFVATRWHQAQTAALLDLIRRQDAALTAVRELADDWLEGRTLIDGSKQMELITARAAELRAPARTDEEN